MKKLLTVSIVSLFCITGCAHSRGQMAMATLSSTSNSTASGTIHFVEIGEGEVEVQADLTGVPPGTHGFHVHDKTECGADGMAAGGHYNPTSAPHGAPDAVSHHAGDFGNVTADAKGEVHARFTTHSITVAPGAMSVVGHAVVLHAGTDDLTTQPTGNSGARIACGIVQSSMAGSMH
jgi:Cu-Zn family superoxide dismutase